MSDMKPQTPSGAVEALLVTLYLRAMESQRPDALIKDKKAEALVKQISAAGLYDFGRIKSLHLSEVNKLVIILRNREFDRYARDFLARHPEAVVVHIGCGLDSRFERVCPEQPDNGQVEWYDLDLPDVIELRRKLIGEEGGHYHLLGCSVLEDAWLDRVSVHRQRPFLFLAEGVFMYFVEEQVKSLVLTLRDRFPGAELAFDAYSPIHVWRHNLQMRTFKSTIHVHWGIWRGQKIEGWAGPSTSLRAGGIRLLDEWGFFDCPEPRLAPYRWMRPIEALARTLRIYHFRLGKPAG
jgi:O-methyltransferase involved in polyketide biosynthesis